MKLRNKKTEEIVKLIGYVNIDDRMFFRFEDDKGVYKKEYNSIAELNAEWEDVPEEPEEYWYIADDCVENDTDDGVAIDRERKQIGNYFGTKEEAEKAVEKLKAWKRLKEKGFRFEKYEKGEYGPIIIELIGYVDKEADSLLDLLFGGEE